MVAKLQTSARPARPRIYLQDGIHDAFVDRAVERVRALKTGPGIDRAVDIGALVNSATREKVHAFVVDAVDRGAQIRIGGTLPDSKGFFYPPTILTDVAGDADCVRGEIFGPVAAIQRFESEDEVVAKANDTEYGLVAYVFSGNMARGLGISERLDYGMIGLNRGLVSDPSAPFGGTKQSGIGREGGADGLGSSWKSSISRRFGDRTRSMGLTVPHSRRLGVQHIRAALSTTCCRHSGFGGYSD